MKLDTKAIMQKLKTMFLSLGKQFTPTKRNRYAVFLQRPRLFIWLVANMFLLFSNFAPFMSSYVTLSIILTVVIYFVIITVALSETAERILRAFQDIRRVATLTEKRRLIPLFLEVASTARKNNKYISEDVKIYIIDEISVNAYAIGRNTVAVTRGLMETMTDDEIKGILAHEFAHLAYGDTTLQLLLTLGTSIYLWVLLFFQMIFKVIADSTKEGGIVDTVFSFVEMILNWSIQIFLVVWTVIIAGSSKKQEYRADRFAYEIGYGEELTAALYKIYNMQISDKRKLIERAQIGHPRIAYRIEKLENRLQNSVDIYS